MAHGKTEKAHEVLAKVHANGNKEDEVVLLELQEIRDTIKLEQEFEGNGWLQLFKTKGNIRRLIILLTLGLFSQWSGNGLASYYLNLVLNQIGITNSNTQLVINGCLQIMNFIVAIGQCFVVDYVGRRTLFLVSTAGMLGSFIVWTACAGEFAKTGVQATGYVVAILRMLASPLTDSCAVTPSLRLFTFTTCFTTWPGRGCWSATPQRSFRTTSVQREW